MGENPKKFRVNGALCGAPVTPMKANGDINLEMIPAMVQHLVDFGIRNAFVTGTNGEMLSMNVAERKAVVEAWIKAAKGKLEKNIVHIGCGNLPDSKELARHAQDIGADAIACVGPSYYRPFSVVEYVDYMKEVAAAAPKMPFFLYDIDFYTHIKIDACDFMSLAAKKIPTLAGCKHTSPNYGSMGHIIREFGDDMFVMMGTDECYLEGLVLGLETTITNTYLGHVMNRIKAAYDKGDIEQARKEQNKAKAITAVRKKYRFAGVDGTKAFMRLLGLDVGPCRLPVMQISAETEANLKKDLEEIGFFEWGTRK